MVITHLSVGYNAYYISIAQLVVAGNPHVLPRIHRMHELVSYISVNDICKFPWSGSFWNQESIRQYIALLVCEFVLITYRIDYNHVKQIEDGLV